jgi:hypothetical protein
VNTNEITTRGPQPVKTVVEVGRALGGAAGEKRNKAYFWRARVRLAAGRKVMGGLRGGQDCCCGGGAQLVFTNRGDQATYFQVECSQSNR